MIAADEERLGWKEVELGRLEAAEAHFRRALELDPSRADALNGLGVVYLSWGEYAQAEELFEMAVRQARERLPQRRRVGRADAEALVPYWRGLYQLAVTFARQGLWEEVLAPLDTLLGWGPSPYTADAFFLLGEAQQRLGQLKAAALAYEEAAEERPLAWYSLGLVEHQAGFVDDAWDHWQRAVRRAPEAAPLILFYPKVLALPVFQSGAEAFEEAAGFVAEQIDLWDKESRATLFRVWQEGQAP
ncbi:MAG: tetratricopeptide repeat protein [Firmicutes bacterium]|nr:tetratricopeptide repeat protein [Alicyclobacillaceae bacterium]MCL6498194.1 tetratricopeptide repeat protein [Bacillota bacterium]